MSAGARLAIVRAAEELFASEGIEGPSLREIARRAGQGNTNAAQYHFGDRDGLLLAVLDRHRDRVEARRGELLDLVEGSEPVEPRTLSTALVAPLVAELSEPDGGAAHLQIVAEVLARPVRFAAPSMRTGRRRASAGGASWWSRSCPPRPSAVPSTAASPWCASCTASWPAGPVSGVVAVTTGSSPATSSTW
jgi:AcrR family transcriptional regulator